MLSLLTAESTSHGQNEMIDDHSFCSSKHITLGMLLLLAQFPALAFAAQKYERRAYARKEDTASQHRE